MSGILGVYYLDGRPVDRADLERMTDSLVHRGPDDAGIWSQGPVGLGHRMLWTTPESLQEKLPLTHQTGDLVITADARIDNRAELLPLLSFSDRPAGEVADSQLILAAYEKWGERCPEKLIGDFAFAIWDGREQKLFCARDHFGVKPFYYYWSRQLFTFASEIKALLCLPEVPRCLNEMMVADYLGMIFEDKCNTFYQDILRLPPAHFLVVNSQGTRLQSYWSLNPSFQLQLDSDQAYAEAYREIFTNAVRCRLRSAFPRGSMLSGGLDSSSITCVARSILASERDDQLQTFSVIFDQVPESDERHFIQTVLAQGNLKPHYIQGDQLSPLAPLERMLWHEDEPFYGPNLFLNWDVWTLAQKQGVRVMLDGIMGDNVVSHGFTYLNELARKWRWVKLAQELNAMTGRRNRRPWKFIWRYVWNDGLKPLAPQPFQQLWPRPKMADNSLDAVINPDFARRTGLVERIQEQEQSQLKRLRSAREDHYQELVSGFIPAAMEVANKGATASNIEVRFPFLDLRLVEFCLALPPEQKLRDGWSRMIARQALVNYLPEEIRWRSDKGDLGVNFIRGFMAEREDLKQLIYHDLQPFEGFVNVTGLRELYQRFVCQQGPSDDEILLLYLVTVLSFWLRGAALKLNQEEVRPVSV